MRKLWSPKIKEVKNSKKINHQTLQKSVPEHPNFLCAYWSLAIRVQRRFVKIQVAFLYHLKLFKINKYRKVMRFESKSAPKRRKKKKKKHILKIKKLFFFLGIFSLLLFLCTSKDDF